MDSRHELIQLTQHNEWYIVQFAVNGDLTRPFWIHRSEEFRCRDNHIDWMSYLHKKADAIYEQFGRHSNPMEVIYA